MNTLTVGDKAPLFVLKDENETEVALSDYLGKKNKCWFIFTQKP